MRKAYVTEIRGHSSHSWTIFTVDTNKTIALDCAKRYSQNHSWDNVRVVMWENGITQTIIFEC